MGSMMEERGIFAFSSAALPLRHHPNVLVQNGPERESEGRAMFKAPAAGKYIFCLSNKMTTLTTKTPGAFVVPGLSHGLINIGFLFEQFFFHYVVRRPESRIVAILFGLVSLKKKRRVKRRFFFCSRSFSEFPLETGKYLVCLCRFISYHP